MKQNFIILSVKLCSSVGGWGGPRHIGPSALSLLTLPGSLGSVSLKKFINRAPVQRSQWAGLPNQLLLLSVAYNSLEEGES